LNIEGEEKKEKHVGALVEKGKKGKRRCLLWGKRGGWEKKEKKSGYLTRRIVTNGGA